VTLDALAAALETGAQQPYGNEGQAWMRKTPKTTTNKQATIGKAIGMDHFDPGHGRLMKAWIVIPHGRAPWVDLAREAYLFVKTGAAR
jgi:hypothetical protein